MMQAMDARDRYLTEYRRFVGNGAARPAPWLATLRETAIEQFAAAGWPTTRQEEWRFTDVGPLAKTPFTLLAAPRTRLSPGAVEGLLGGAVAPRLVFVDGMFDPALSSMQGLPSGVKLGSLAQRLAQDGDLIAAHLGRYAGVERNPFTALSTAFVRDGALVYVPSRVAVDQPIYVLFVTSSAARGTVMHPRNLVILEREAAATVVETYATLDEAQHFTNAVTEFVVGEGAWGQHLRLQRESEAAFHMATSQYHQDRDSSTLSSTVAFGSALSRHDVNAVLDGAAARLWLNGLSLLRGHQHVDHHTTIDHAQPHGESHELFNGILGDHARGVFNGRIVVRPGAQRTDSKQTNNNVLLSERARADSQPQLEIYADDVKCTHGATIGPLDPNALFYLQARGVGPVDARQLLTYGIAADVVSRVSLPAVRQRLDQLVRARLAA